MARIVHSPAAEDDLLEIWVGLALSYVIVYRPIMGGVELVRVVHGARDLERLLS